MNKLGLYIHVPFCAGKCPYCDFYSLEAHEADMERYTNAVEEALVRRETAGQGLALRRERVDTVYFGGGTPNLLGAQRLGRILKAAGEAFSIAPQGEITAEANPTWVDLQFFFQLKEAGFNRLSMGLQSANEEELRLLGRKHSPKDVEKAVSLARAAGIDNISLDIMLGLPGGSKDSLLRSIDFAAGLGVEHISSYILKVEENTPFACRALDLPGDDEGAEEYLFCVRELEKRGYRQYEISNFAKPGRESRHNLIYWQGEEYLGFGPGAHSFYGGRRFFYPRDLEGFIRGLPPQEDGKGGGFGEYAMLSLRLTSGLRGEACVERYGSQGGRYFEEMLQRAKNCPPGLILAGKDAISFTPEGFLVSNLLILRLLPPEA